MQRKITDSLLEWKNKKDRKPLVLKGARQVGKTWILKEFGIKHFKSYHHFDFERDKKKLIPIFEGDINPEMIIRDLSLVFNCNIDPKNDLLIFDEVQNIPRALTSLKYFCEELPELAICAAGSLLGILLSDESFPVGKVEFLNIYPMSFDEFLLNYGNELLYQEFTTSAENKVVSKAIHLKFIEILKEFYVTGGMPEVVDHYLKGKKGDAAKFSSVREKQKNLIKSFTSDFSKHSGKVNAAHITSVFENVPLQLAKDINESVKRYRFKNVVKGKRGFTELRGPIDWLCKAELIFKVNICNRSEIPLMSFCKANIFKLYMMDVGLLGAMLEIPPSAILIGNYGMIKGYFIENFVANELIKEGDNPLYSWNERNSEIEFLIICDGVIIPVEVKSGKRTKAKSLQQYILKYNPSHAIMLSEKNISQQDNLRTNIPLYFAGKLKSGNLL